jgi:DNA-binding NarL/FixJ family response regulator
MNPAPPIRLLLVDDHEMVRAGLRAILRHYQDLEIVGEAETGRQAVALIESLQPDVVLLDLRLPDISGLEVCRQAAALGCEPRILILTSFLEDQSALEALESGAAGFLLKQIGHQALHQAIQEVMAGKVVVPPEVAGSLAQAAHSRARRENAASRLDSLSPQEVKIAQLVAEGLLNKEIGDRLGLSEKTVRNYLGNIFVKTGVSRRAQLASLVTSWNKDK